MTSKKSYNLFWFLVLILPFVLLFTYSFRNGNILSYDALFSEFTSFCNSYSLGNLQELFVDLLHEYLEININLSNVFAWFASYIIYIYIIRILVSLFVSLFELCDFRK